MADVVIVGAGECGVRCAFALREAGFDGSVTLIGDEPHLPYERPPLSKEVPVAAKTIATEEAYTEANIDLRRGTRVTEIDRAAKSVRLSDGGDVTYDTLVLATGARARVLPGLEDALTLRTLDDAEAILARLSPGSRLAIVGGGFIGLELAATARGLGAEVTVVEAADRLMARIVPSDIALAAETRHREAGVELLLDAKVDRVGDGELHLTDGRAVQADVLVAGVGSVPETALAEAAGLAVDPNIGGIVVDHCFRTEDPAIFAAGDCCNFPWGGGRVRLESWRAAQDQANHVANAIMGRDDAYARVPWFWSDQHDQTLQVAGLPDPFVQCIRRDIGDGAFILFQLDADGGILSASGIGTGNAVARDIRAAEKMIEAGIKPDPAALADPNSNLKRLLRG